MVKTSFGSKIRELALLSQNTHSIPSSDKCNIMLSSRIVGFKSDHPTCLHRNRSRAIPAAPVVTRRCPGKRPCPGVVPPAAARGRERTAHLAAGAAREAPGKHRGSTGNPGESGHGSGTEALCYPRCNSSSITQHLRRSSQGPSSSSWA